MQLSGELVPLSRGFRSLDVSSNSDFRGCQKWGLEREMHYKLRDITSNAWKQANLHESDLNGTLAFASASQTWAKCAKAAGLLAAPADFEPPMTGVIGDPGGPRLDWETSSTS